MAKKLYIGGLCYDTTEPSLKETFLKAGKVESAVIITDKMSGRSKGFGFVEMSTDEEALEAIKMFNGTQLDGRTITVAEARSPQPGGARTGNSGGGFARRNRDRDFDRKNRW